MKRIPGTLFLLIAFSSFWEMAHSADSLAWVRTGGPPGGLGYDIRYNFDNPDIWYATDNFAGVHISTDNGLTWQPANNGIPQQAGPTGDATPIFSLTVDPNDPQILWAGTNPTGHVYRSEDGGQTWESRDNGITVEYGGGLTFRGFTVDPTRSNIVYAMAEISDPVSGGGIWGDGTGGQVYKTIDSGANWEKIWDGGIPSSLCRYLWVDPRDTDVLYVSTGIFDRGAAGEGDPETDNDPFGGVGILKSMDGGETWDVQNEDNGLNCLYLGSLYMHPENPDILLVAAGHITPGNLLDHLAQQQYSPYGIYRTANGGDTWTQVYMPEDNWSECFTAVEFYEPDPDIAYAGSANAIYRSEDAGLTWTRVSTKAGDWGPPGITAGWPIDLQCDPRDPDRIFANNYNGGNFLSEDGGKTWSNASQGYTGSQMRRVAVDPLNPARIYAAGRSGLWRSDDGGANWQGIFYPPVDPPSPPGLEWQSVFADPHRSGHILAGIHLIMESDDGGSTWISRYNASEIEGLPKGTGRMVTSIAFAPSDSNIIYANLCSEGVGNGHERVLPIWQQAGAGVVISQDGGTTWNRSTDENIQYAGVIDIAVDPADADKVYGCGYGGIYKSEDRGVTWEFSHVVPEDVLVRAVAVDPFDSGHILAGLEGMGIFTSPDGGQTWEPGYAGMESNGSMHDIVFDPMNQNRVYASDYFSGVYQSRDGGETWIKINNNLRSRTCMGLAISSDGRHLYVAVDGDGVNRMDINGIPVGVKAIHSFPVAFNLGQNYPNPFNPQTTVTYQLPAIERVEVRIFNLLGRELAVLVNEEQSAGPHRVIWDASSMSSGTYLIRFQAGKSVQFQKCILLK